MRKANWVTVIAVATICSMSALADHDSDKSSNNSSNNNGNDNGGFTSSVIGSTPAGTVGGVVSGGAPWVVRQGRVSLTGGGRLQVDVQGLLIGAAPGVPANLVGTVGPVLMVAASVVCGGSGGTVAANTSEVMLTAAGDARIDTVVGLPAMCGAPVILVRIFNNNAAPGSQLGPFIGLTGISSMSQTSGHEVGEDPPNHQ